ncbi:glycosyltransferase family 39 protein [Nostoc sp. CENA67]|uniref:Glycosyltransferase family 39 protein n=1 Tax=Amazonocrinis nigriterrae CENA67 TaxID=2794033 RepID=A0A8J7HVX9_9NOST|nr:glycosyltransferase family 39 protein [Amazonocrinis nigriterrae]MBH8566846.1 glycosyltransferase family 39 protein [Amazonocrinis nigriterrae CENA67]
MPERLKANLIFTIEVLSIFLFCIITYLANGVTISSGDAIPNTLLAFNLLENHTFHFDAFRESYFCSDNYSPCYFFTEANNGHLSSVYPIGPAIVTFPLYLVFYVCFKYIYGLSASVPLDLTSANFEVYRILFEKLAATITTAVTVVIFYLSTRLKFDRNISLVSTFVFAFATNTWMTSSQGLWQHGISNLAVTSIIFCLLKANRAVEQRQKNWLLLAGFACGLLPGIRPTSTLYMIAAIVYSVFTYQLKSIYLFFGLFSAIPSILWNLYYFSNLTGGYSKLFSGSPYIFNFNNFIKASLGTFISPSRGLLIFSPIVLYFLPGAYQVFKLRSTKDEKMIACMTIAAIILSLSYCFYIVWWAGFSYGSRFMTDIMPIICYLLNYFLTIKIINNRVTKTFIINISVFICLLVFSTLTQFVGAFGYNPGGQWNSIPLNIDKYQYRLWNIRDNPIERNANALFYKIIKLPIDNAVYIQDLDGVIKKVMDENNQPFGSLILVKAGSQKIIKANIENTGLSKWFGYESAIEKGEVRVRGRFYDENNQQINEVRLFVSGNPKQYESSNAIASIIFPEKPGMYKLTLDLIAEGLGEFPQNVSQPKYVIDVKVED